MNPIIAIRRGLVVLVLRNNMITQEHRDKASEYVMYQHTCGSVLIWHVKPVNVERIKALISG